MTRTYEKHDSVGSRRSTGQRSSQLPSSPPLANLVPVVRVRPEDGPLSHAENERP